MNRKTNLFYTSGNDSSFLTFSNYTEHMTGVYLSTEHKLFPSRFLCLYSERLNSNFEVEKKNLIKNYLVGYYENKLAFLRDKLIAEGKDPDMNMLYFNYLITALFNYDSSMLYDENGKPSIHIGEISEQDYNGTFADIICTIDSNEIKKGNIVLNNGKDNFSIYEYDKSGNYLYSWYNTTNEGTEEPICPGEYNDVKPLFDKLTDNGVELSNEETDTKQYFIDSEWLSIKMDEDIKKLDIKFNIIIPLYDCVNVNYETNTTMIIENEPIDLVFIDDYAKLVPYGLWTTEYPVELKRDPETKFGQSWSLVIGTQFKPFPNSNYLVTDEYVNDTTKSFSSFAYILSNQNQLIDQIKQYSYICSSLREKVIDLEKKVNTEISDTKIKELEKQITDLRDIILNGEDSAIIKLNKKNKWEISK